MFTYLCLSLQLLNGFLNDLRGLGRGLSVFGWVVVFRPFDEQRSSASPHPVGKLVEELREHLVCVTRHQFGPTESIDPVAGEPETPVIGNHLAIENRACDIAHRVVLLAVYLGGLVGLVVKLYKFSTDIPSQGVIVSKDS